jgi:UPF0176 protein
MNKRILLYYKYVTVPSPQVLHDWQLELCQSLGLTGRVLIADEGINGTLCGSLEATQQYIDAMSAHELFGGTDFKESIVNAQHEYFPNLQIKIKKEICHIGLQEKAAHIENTGVRLTPQQAHDMMQNPPKDLVILDGRNDYEAAVGAFQNAIIPPIDNFREFPRYIDQNLEAFKDKQVLMYCTGGVRCERATAYLKEKGVAQEVYHIEGGIHRYAEQFPDGFFRGKNYVFDGRITVPITDDILGTCLHCQTSCDEYTNCRNSRCNKHFISCPNCLEKLNNACSERCAQLLATGAVPPRPDRPRVNPNF